MFASPSQILCTVFGLNIYCYGVILAFAIVVGIFISEYFGNKYFGLKKETIIDMSPYVIIFGIIGARLYYCLLNFGFYLRFPTEILALRHGGISIHGAILGGLIGLLIFSKRHKISALKLADVSAIGLSLAQAIGRWGNFFNSEAYGTPTNLPWKLYIAPQYRQIPYENYEYYHPAFLYESILDLLIFAFLFIMVRKNFKIKEGNFAFIYLILYSTARIIVEYFRIDSVLYIKGIPVAIIVSAGIILISSVVLLIRNLPRDKKI